MKRRSFVEGALVMGAALGAPPVLAQTEGPTGTPEPGGDTVTEATMNSGYAPVNGLQMYYEIHGSGGPLLLLHGAFATIDMWGLFLQALASEHQVIAVELQGHGHTADIDRALRIEQLADDAAALLDHLGISQTDVVGYSLGGMTALQLAIRHPALVRKQVVISGNYRTDGYYPEALASIESITPDAFAGSPVEAAYRRSAPNPDNLPLLIEKIQDLEAQTFAWPEDAVSAIAAPTLLIGGDSDVIRPEHTVQLFRLLGGGVPGDLTGLPKSQLAIIPGATHVSLVEQWALWLPMVEAFLAAPLPDHD